MVRYWSTLILSRIEIYMKEKWSECKNHKFCYNIRNFKLDFQIMTSLRHTRIQICKACYTNTVLQQWIMVTNDMRRARVADIHFMWTAGYWNFKLWRHYQRNTNYTTTIISGTVRRNWKQYVHRPTKKILKYQLKEKQQIRQLVHMLKWEDKWTAWQSHKPSFFS